MTPKKPRLKDIAMLAGVSIGTVDRVLHERGEVAEKTRQKVQRILKETNYSPDVMAQALKLNKIYHLATLLPEPDENNHYWQKHPLGVKKAIEELAPFTLSLTQVTFDIQSEEDFLKKADIILKLKPDGLLLAPIFKKESIEYCKQLHNQNIPFVFIDGFIDNTGFLAYIGEDTWKSGRVAGQLIDMVTCGKKTVLVVNISRNIQNIHHLNNRTLGFLSYLEKQDNKDFKRINISIPEPTPESVRVEMDKVFKRNPDIGSIFISGSRSYLIAQYLEDEGLSSVNLIGYDLLDLNVKYLRMGITRFLIGQRPEQQTYKGIKKLFEYLSLNKIPEKIEYLPCDIVTSENVDFFLK